MKPAHKLLARQIAALAALTCVPFFGAYLGACSSTSTPAQSAAFKATPESAKVGESTSFRLTPSREPCGYVQVYEASGRLCTSCATNLDRVGETVKPASGEGSCVWTVTWKQAGTFVVKGAAYRPDSNEDANNNKLTYTVTESGGSSSSSSSGGSSSSSGGVVDSGTDGSEGGACTPAGAQCGAEFPVCCAGLSCEANGTMKTCQLPK